MAAVSGGADSTALLVALCAVLDRSGEAFGGKAALYCVHINHNLRGQEAAEDAQFTKNLCGKLDVPFKLFTVPAGEIHKQAARHGCGIEAAAREVRHAIFREEAERLGASRILIAHTRDDLLETILFRLLRGSAPAGLSPMPQDSGTIFRPLLGLSRAEILRYLDLKKIPYRTDSTNDDLNFTRNRIRHTLIPALTKHFSGWEAELLFFADTQRRTAAHLANIAGSHVTVLDKNSAHIAGCAELDGIVVEEAVYCAVNRLDAASAEDANHRFNTMKAAVPNRAREGHRPFLDMRFCRKCALPALRRDGTAAFRLCGLGRKCAFSALRRAGELILRAITARHGCRWIKARPQALMSICDIIARQIDKLKNRHGWRFLSSARDRSGNPAAAVPGGEELERIARFLRSKNAPIYGIPAGECTPDSGSGLFGCLPAVDFMGERKRGIRRRALREWLESGKKTADIGVYTLEWDGEGGITVLRKDTALDEGYALSVAKKTGRVVYYSSRFW